MTTTPVLGIPELVQGQNTPHTTFNVAAFVLSVLGYGVTDRGIDTPPGSPSEGDSYIVGTSPTGAWANRANCIAGYYGGQWRFVPGDDDAGSPISMGSAQEGLSVWVKDESKRYVWSDTGGSPSNYVWRDEGATRFVELTGDTMSGSLIVNVSSGAALQGNGDGGGGGCTVTRYSNAATGTGVAVQKARGSQATPASVQQNDILSQHSAVGYSSSAFRTAADYIFQVIAASPSSTDMEALWTLNLCPSGSAARSEIARFNHAAGFSMFGSNPVIDANRLFQNRVYTVATLPSGAQGKQAYASDLRVFNGAGTQEGAGAGTGGAVQHNGTAWKIAGTNVTAVA